MADRNLDELLAPITGDDPSPEAVDRMWRRLDAELTDTADTPDGPTEDVMEVTLTPEPPTDPRPVRRRPVVLAVAAAAAAVLVVFGLLLASGRLDDDPDDVRTTDDSAADAGPLEQFFTVYIEEGAAAAIATGLVPDTSLDTQIGEWLTLREDLDFADRTNDGLRRPVLDCTTDGSVESCIIESDTLFPVLQRDRILYEAEIADGRIVDLEWVRFNHSPVFTRYAAWLADNHPERLELSCLESGWRCFNDPVLMRQFFGSAAFADRPLPVRLPGEAPSGRLDAGPLEQFLDVYFERGAEAAMANGPLSEQMLADQSDRVFTFEMLFTTAETDWRQGSRTCRRDERFEYCMIEFDGAFFELTGRPERIRLGVALDNGVAQTFEPPLSSSQELREDYFLWLSRFHPDRVEFDCLVDSGCYTDPALIAEFGESDAFDGPEPAVDPIEPSEPPPADPLFEWLTAYVDGGIDAADATRLVSSAEVFFRDQWLFFERDGAEIECAVGPTLERCLVTVDGPFTETLGRPDRILFAAVKEDGSIIDMRPIEYNNAATRTAYLGWLGELDREGVCVDTTDPDCTFAPELVAEFAASGAFVDEETTVGSP